MILPLASIFGVLLFVEDLLVVVDLLELFDPDVVAFALSLPEAFDVDPSSRVPPDVVTFLFEFESVVAFESVVVFESVVEFEFEFEFESVVEFEFEFEFDFEPEFESVVEFELELLLLFLFLITAPVGVVKLPAHSAKVTSAQTDIPQNDLLFIT